MKNLRLEVYDSLSQQELQIFKSFRAKTPKEKIFHHIREIIRRDICDSVWIEIKGEIDEKNK